MPKIAPEDSDASFDIATSDEIDNSPSLSHSDDIAEPKAHSLNRELQNSLETVSFQAELNNQPEISVFSDGPKSALEDETAKTLGTLEENDQLSVSASTVNPGDTSKPISESAPRTDVHLQEALATMNELLAWKEDLRLLAMHHNTLGHYNDNWTKEANLFFRRVVIINRRLDRYRRKQRA